MKTLQKYLVKIPKSSLLGNWVRLLGRKLCLHALIRNNIDQGEVSRFEIVSGYSSITLRDGTSLSAIDGEIPYYKGATIPSEYCGVVVEYITRYKYPHFMPSARIRTGLIPRNHFPLFLDPQKSNTLYELPPQDIDEFQSALELKKGDQVLEIGAFIGFGALRMSRIVGAEGRVLSIEADEEHFNVLNLNLEQNNITNVTSLYCTVADVDEDELDIYKAGSTSNSIVEGVIEDGEVSKVKAKSIKTILSENSMEPNFLILTVNGAELLILEACREFLINTTSLRIIAPGWYDDGQGKVGPRIADYLKSIGFRVSQTPGFHVFAYK
ncbi:MAG: hypothetical protein CMI26_01520 [Opitutae bacterium]|nr:hypothetical protein [Opitutae bacterium]|tara:strand:- start:1726 stop:2700 length:975 start_codon:yes stop_codon:yes gene_type:complete